jgi:hypothetical protein
MRAEEKIVRHRFSGVVLVLLAGEGQKILLSLDVGWSGEPKA